MLQFQLLGWILLSLGARHADTAVVLRRIDPSRIEYPLRLAIRDSGSYRLWWERAKNNTEFDSTPAPPVDFAKDLVILVAMGAGGGTDIRVASVDTAGTVMRVGVELTAPANDCNLPAVVSYPVEIVRVPNRRSIVVFEERFKRYSCGEPFAFPDSPEPRYRAAKTVSLRHEWSGGRDPVRAVLDDSAAFAYWWSVHARNPKSPPPPVDFSKYMVVVAAMGLQPSTLHDIRIQSVDSVGWTLNIHVLLTAPCRGCLAGGALTAPADIVRIPKSYLPAVFVERFDDGVR